MMQHDPFLLEDVRFIATKNADGDTFIRHAAPLPVEAPVLTGIAEPQVAVIDRMDWKFVDSCLTGFTIGLICVATFYVGKLAVEAVAWAVTR